MAPISNARRLELLRSTPFKSEADGGKNLEVAMAATVFKRLQDAGLIPQGAKLASRLPKVAGLESTTYEARLVELIKDANGNGHFDLDLEALAGAGLLAKPQTAEQLEAILTGRTAGTIPDAFLDAQQKDSRLVGPKREAVIRYANGLELQRESDVATFHSIVDRAATEPSAVEKQAIATALLLAARGKKEEARALLEATGDALEKAGHFAAARGVFEELAKDATPRHLLRGELDLTRTNHAFDEKSNALLRTTAGNEATIETRNFQSTVGEAAKLRLAQLGFRERMAVALGRAADPTSMKDVGAYFQAFAKGKDTTAVSHEFAAYLQAWYRHVGEGVKWNPKIPQDERPARLDELFDGQLADEAHRRVIDCEGFAWLAARVLGGVTKDDGSKRFQVEYASTPTHIIAAVTEPATGQLFTVNNEKVGLPAAGTALARQERIAQEVCGKYPNLLRISPRQSDSEALDGDFSRAPKLGSLIWDGERLAGEIDEVQQRRYLAYTERRLNGRSFNDWLGSEL